MTQFRGTFFSYRRSETVISNLDLEIGPGLILLLGEDGCGKSTLLKLAAGIEAPDGGAVKSQVTISGAKKSPPAEISPTSPSSPTSPPTRRSERSWSWSAGCAGCPPRKSKKQWPTRRFPPPSPTVPSANCQWAKEEKRSSSRPASENRATPYSTSRLETMDCAALADILEWISQLLDAEATVIVVSHDIEPFVARAARALALHGGQLTSYEALPEDWGSGW